jgi:low temperature requirement protein LtrA
MWWLYFDHSERAGAKAIAAAAEPGRIARLAYTYVHAVIIAGIVLTSVADKEVLSHPHAEMTLSTAVVLVGGPLLYVLGMLLFRLVVARELLVSYLVGIGALLVAFAAAFVLTPLQLGAVTTVVLVIVAGWETVVRVRRGTDDKKAG